MLEQVLDLANGIQGPNLTFEEHPEGGVRPAFPARRGYRVRDMKPNEIGYTRAWHEINCDELPVGHPVEEHEPFDDDDGAVAWAEFEAMLAKHGVRIVLA